MTSLHDLLHYIDDDAAVRPPRVDDVADRAALYRSAAAGELVRLAPGVYVPSRELQSLTPEERHRLHARVVWPRARENDVLSHRSAAAWWGLPVYGPLPARPETVLSGGVRRSSSATFLRHVTSRPVVATVVRGLPVTSLARTVVDVAATSSFEAGVVVADAALRLGLEALARGAEPPLSADELERELSALGSDRGAARAQRVLAFADGRAQLPGESVSRCTMLRIGCPMPELQHRVVSESGRIYYLDFWWPGQRIAGEFDGESKYREEKYRGGRTPEQVLLDEKAREDEIRLDVAGFGRWRMPVARDRRALTARLRRMGLQW